MVQNTGRFVIKKGKNISLFMIRYNILGISIKEKAQIIKSKRYGRQFAKQKLWSNC